MSQVFDVAEAKSRFSELLNRACYSHERFLIRKRGKPVAAIVSPEDLEKLEEHQPPTKRGILAVTGLFADIPEAMANTVTALQIILALIPRTVHNTQEYYGGAKP